MKEKKLIIQNTFYEERGRRDQYGYFAYDDYLEMFSCARADHDHSTQMSMENRPIEEFANVTKPRLKSNRS